MAKPIPPQAILKEWFDYDPETGVFVWRKEPRPIRPVLGKIAGTRSKPTGYIMICVPNFGQFGAHRLAWVYVHGRTIGGAEVDHRDTNPSNNAIRNLRLATSTEQKQNKKVQSNNKSGLKGAYYHACRRGKKWRSQIAIREAGAKRVIFLGYFDTASEAHQAYGNAARKYFGEFARVA